MRRPDVLIVYKKSLLQLAAEKHNTRIQRLLHKRDPSVAPMQASHEAHDATLVEVERALKAERVEHKKVYRARLKPEMIDGKLVVSVGGDGTLLDASHKVVDQSVLGVNSDPGHSVGFLCAGHRGNFAALLADLLSDAWRPTPVRRLSGTIDDEPLPFPVLNDVLVAHKNPAATSRYFIEHRARQKWGSVEDHRSSGVWVSTAAGSTAAVASAGGTVVELDDERCQVRVREPFLADGPPLALASFWLERGDAVAVTSKMREGRVYLDGPHEAFDLPTGARLLLQDRAPPLMLYATDDMKRRRELARKNQE